MRILRSRIPGFQSQVHKQQRSAERNYIRLIVIPYSLHILIRLCTGSIISTAYLLLVILVEGKNKVYLIILIRISQFQCVMITSRHIPVQSAQNTLIVINQCLTPQLGKKAVSEIKFCPCFVQDKTPVLVELRILSPNSDVLCRHLDFQVRPLVVNGHDC